jgi:hypothetical protein
MFMSCCMCMCMYTSRGGAQEAAGVWRTLVPTISFTPFIPHVCSQVRVVVHKKRWASTQSWFADVFRKPLTQPTPHDDEKRQRVAALLVANWASVASTGATLSDDEKIVAKAEELGEAELTAIAEVTAVGEAADEATGLVEEAGATAEATAPAMAPAPEAAPAPAQAALEA